MQLSWLVADDAGNVVKESDNIIKPEGYTIPAGAAAVHGITTEIAHEQGRLSTEVWMEFMMDAENSRMLCCHNFNFDMPILQAELHRKRFDAEIDKPSFCTMRSSTDYCRLPGNYGYKWPKLEELYRICFGREMENAHNAMADVQATYECYFYLKEEGVF